MVKTILRLLGMGMVAIIVLAACSDNNVSNPLNNTEENIDLSDLDTAEASLTIYAHMYNGEWGRDWQPLLEAKFPHYDFTFISAYDETAGLSVEELITTGTKIDLYQGAVGSLEERFMPVELHEPMNELMERHGIDPNDFIPEFLKGGMDGDDYLMLPYQNSNFVVYYNKDIFDRFGVDHPVDGMTWDEAIAKAEEVTRYDGKQYVGLWFSPKHILRANQKSLGFVNPDTNEPIINTKEWNELITKLFYEPMRNPGLQDRVKRSFQLSFRNDDEVAMLVFTSGWLNESQFLPVNWDVISVPTFDGDGVGTQPLAKYWGLASTSENKDAAMRVIKYFMSEEFQAHWSRRGDMGTLKSDAVQSVLYEDVTELQGKNYMNAIFTNDRYAEQRVITSFDEIVIEGPLADDIIPEIIRGNMNVNEGLILAQDSAKQAIEQELLRRQVGE